MKFKTSSSVSDLETWTRLIYIHNKSLAKFRCNFKPPNSSPMEIHLGYRAIKERSLLKRNLNHWILTKIKFNDRAQRGEKRRSIRIRLRHLVPIKLSLESSSDAIFKSSCRIDQTTLLCRNFPFSPRTHCKTMIFIDEKYWKSSRWWIELLHENFFFFTSFRKPSGTAGIVMLKCFRYNLCYANLDCFGKSYRARRKLFLPFVY